MMKRPRAASPGMTEVVTATGKRRPSACCIISSTRLATPSNILIRLASLRSRSSSGHHGGGWDADRTSSGDRPTSSQNVRLTRTY